MLLRRAEDASVRAVARMLSPAGRCAHLTTLIFHRVLPQPDPLFPGEVDARMFDTVMGWVKSWFNVLPLEEAVSRLRDGTLPARAAAITFDDGYADNYSLAKPILQRHGLSATFFIATSFLNGGRMWNDTIIESIRRTDKKVLDLSRESLGNYSLKSVEESREAITALIRKVKHLESGLRDNAVACIALACDAALPKDLMMTDEQIRKMSKAGMSIGAHTHTHPILSCMDHQQARDDIRRGRDTLSQIVDEKIRSFAYPNGRFGKDFHDQHINMVRELDFETAVSTDAGVANFSSNPLCIPRFTPWDRTKRKFAGRILINMINK